ncbi:MAG: CoA transferase [Deltaproteobacteria bacterium]|nr:CoA transferase [Deltaproteobacteria bacterium]MBW2665632.1 CoA transferase [Deltaproteobacteria bacterium]
MELSGPLMGLRIIEIGGIGPGPFCAMMLADMGAEVIRVNRSAGTTMDVAELPFLARGRRSIALDLKTEAGLEALLKLVEKADGLIEGFRPGVTERLGFGPEICLERNPAIVYGRMTGWGQTGPMAQMAGHDINYISLSGALGTIGRKDEAPLAPLNLVGDFGGGGMLLAFGVLAALLERQRSGRGQVVDASMVEGSALLMTMMYEMLGAGFWNLERGTNSLDCGAPFYDSYECADGKFISLGSLEPKFFAVLIDLLGLEPSDQAGRNDPANWPSLRERIGTTVRQRTRKEWEDVLGGSDACFAPVLDMSEAPSHPHNVARETFIDVGGVIQPAPAPRFSRTPGRVSAPAATRGEHGREILADWGFGPEEIERLEAARGLLT